MMFHILFILVNYFHFNHTIIQIISPYPNRLTLLLGILHNCVISGLIFIVDIFTIILLCLYILNF